MLAARSYFGGDPISAGDLLVPAVQKLSLISQGDSGESTNGSGGEGGAGDKSSEVAMVSE